MQTSFVVGSKMPVVRSFKRAIAMIGRAGVTAPTEAHTGKTKDCSSSFTSFWSPSTKPGGERGQARPESCSSGRLCRKQSRCC